MNKSIYSLILMDDVVNAIDRIALRKNTSRSNLVNQILAEYVSLMTPEERIGGIYKRIEELMSRSEDLILISAPKNGTMSLKSSLNYRYRPTIHYEVQLYVEPERYIGALNVTLRTQSGVLITALTDFFRMIEKLENRYIQPIAGARKYEIGGGHFIRSIISKRGNENEASEIGEAITNYIEMLDKLMKDYIEKGFSPNEIEKEYVAYLNSGVGII